MRTLYGTVLLVAAVLFLAVSRLLRNAQTCACEQTYMYSSYTEVPVLHPRWAKHRYKLRLYRETSFSKQALPPTGLPALLVPGNAGSYEQVRSLASETSRLAAQARRAGGAGSNIADMDWYALDLNGELSAFDGHLLAEQAAFALACLKQLRAMYSIADNSSSCSSQGQAQQRLSPLPYNLRPQPLSLASSSGNCGAAAAVVPAVVLAGHSMGGVVARAAATAAWTHPELGPGSLALLLVLASPQQYPPLLLQPGLARFYSGAPAQPLPPGLPAVSVHGGSADLQVSPYLTRLPRSALRLPSSSSSSSSSSNSVAAVLSLASLHVPGVWLSAGHNQVDWCNQLVRRLSAALLEVHALQQQRLQQQLGEVQEQQRGRALLRQQQQFVIQQLLQKELRATGRRLATLSFAWQPGLCWGSNDTCATPRVQAAPATPPLKPSQRSSRHTSI
ncbi:PGAP1-like protein-domain-containing protein [Scenedesmus sp. NREL 46B-D3]|nr:PGAP1-like protein-domain-containing protein [Scenedesmus sp. NREL 46B-D3]